MPKPTRAEMAALVERLQQEAEVFWPADRQIGGPMSLLGGENLKLARLLRSVADAIEALMQERAEPVATVVDAPMCRANTSWAIDVQLPVGTKLYAATPSHPAPSEAAPERQEKS